MENIISSYLFSENKGKTIEFHRVKTGKDSEFAHAQSEARYRLLTAPFWMEGVFHSL